MTTDLKGNFWHSGLHYVFILTPLSTDNLAYFREKKRQLGMSCIIFLPIKIC